jgi:L-asparaginase
MKKVCLVFTGGTFSMKENDWGNKLSPVQNYDEISEFLPDLKSVANIEIRYLFNIDSVNITPHHWQLLAAQILDDSNNFDGFVIIHGTDTMTYTAAALSFLLIGLNKPVILTGAMRPITKTLSDARNNLLYAVELATYNIPEVCIFFGTNLLRGNRTIKISSNDYNAFRSPNFPPLAVVGLEINLNNSVFLNHFPGNAQSGFSSKVACIRYFPGLNNKILDSYLSSSYDAIVIESLGTGNLPYDDPYYLNWIKKASQKGKIIILASQSPFGKVNLDYYKFQSEFLDAGAVPALDMTLDTVLVKTMFLIGAYEGQVDKIRRELHVNLAGELTSSLLRN